MPCDIRREGWQSMSKKRTGCCTQSNALGNVTHSDIGRFIRVAHKRRYGCSRRHIRCFISSICCQRINSSQKLKQSIKLQLAWWNIDRICVWPGVSVTPEKCVMPTSYAICGTPFKSLPVKGADKEKLTRQRLVLHAAIDPKIKASAFHDFEKREQLKVWRGKVKCKVKMDWVVYAPVSMLEAVNQIQLSGVILRFVSVILSRCKLQTTDEHINI